MFYRNAFFSQSIFLGGFWKMEIQATAFSLEDRLKQENFDEQQPKKLYEPSQSELCETVILLKQIMPHRSLERAIIMLYETLVKQKTPQEIYESQLATPEKSPAQNPTIPVTVSEVSRSYNKEELIKTTFANQAQQNKYKDKRLVAKSFVAKGYSYQHALEEFTKAKFDPVDKAAYSFNKDAYKLTISAVINQAWKRLQYFLMEDCKKKITCLGKAEMKKLMTSLLSSSVFGDNIAIFKKYIRLIYGLSNVTIIEGQSIKFYLEAMKQLHGKPFTMQELQRRDKGDASETNSQDCLKKGEHRGQVKIEECVIIGEKQFAKHYLEQKSLTKCLNLLQGSFPSKQALRQEFYKILRRSLNYLQSLMKQKSSSSALELKQKDIQGIFTSKQAESVRLMLLEHILDPKKINIQASAETIHSYLNSRQQKQSLISSLQEENANLADLGLQVKQQQDSSSNE